MAERPNSDGTIPSKDRPATPGERVANLVNNSRGGVGTPIESEIARIVNQERYDPIGHDLSVVEDKLMSDMDEDDLRAAADMVYEGGPEELPSPIKHQTHMGD